MSISCKPGYIMLAVLGASAQGMASLVYYVVVYIVANLAVFGVIGMRTT